MNLGSVSVALIALAIVSGAKADAYTNYADVFGITNGPTVNGGVIVVDDEYLEVPYHFTRTGIEVRVNGRLLPVDVPYRWPPQTWSEYIKGKDPDAKLLHLTRQSTFDELYGPTNSHAFDKRMMLALICSNETELAAQYCAWLAGLPFVASVRNSEVNLGRVRYRIDARSFSGEERSFQINIDDCWWFKDKMRETIDLESETTNWLANINNQMLSLAMCLENSDGFYVVYSNSTSLRQWDTREMVMRLPAAWAVQRSKADADAKQKLFRKIAGCTDSPYSEVDRLHFFSHFKPTPQFEERLAALAARLGICPITTNELMGAPSVQTNFVHEPPPVDKSLLFVSAGPGGSVNHPQVSWLTNGSVAVIEAIPSNGWQFVEWRNLNGMGASTNMRDNPIRVVVAAGGNGLMADFSPVAESSRRQ